MANVSELPAERVTASQFAGAVGHWLNLAERGITVVVEDGHWHRVRAVLTPPERAREVAADA